MLAVRPDLVRLERAKPETGTALPNMRSASGSMRIVLKSHMRTATGIVGDPRPATSVKGEKILVAMAAAVAAFIKTFDVELS
jgi:creatinine amidohydrolase/Fe(II)-dependent formamide hydrolase-like protein